MATIYEVAALAGVSPATVSRALNGAPVSPANLQKVLDAASELSFVPNRAARNLRRRSSEVIALVIPDIENPFFTALSRGVEDVALEAGYSVVLCNSDEQQVKQERYLGVALSEHMAGIVLAPAHGASDLSAVRERGTPLVAVDRSMPGQLTDVVLADNRGGGRWGAEVLLDAGYRRVACITGPADVETSRLRAAGWADVVAARTPGLDREAYLRHSDYRVEGGAVAMASLLDAPDPPDAVFVANNLMAVGAVQVLLDRGTPPPAVGLAAFGDLPFGTLQHAGVHVLPLPSRTLGMTAAELLLERIRGATHEPRTVVLPNDADLRRQERTAPQAAAQPETQSAVQPAAQPLPVDAPVVPGQGTLQRQKG